MPPFEITGAAGAREVTMGLIDYCLNRRPIPLFRLTHEEMVILIQKLTPICTQVFGDLPTKLLKHYDNGVPWRAIRGQPKPLTGNTKVLKIYHELHQVARRSEASFTFLTKRRQLVHILAVGSAHCEIRVLDEQSMLALCQSSLPGVPWPVVVIRSLADAVKNAIHEKRCELQKFEEKTYTVRTMISNVSL